MDQTPIDQITRRLDLFEEAIRDTEQPYGTFLNPGRRCASAPYVEQHRIRSLLDGCDDKGPGFSDSVARFSRLSERLALLRKSRNRGHRDALLAELNYFIGSYHAEICWQEAGASSPVDQENYSSREIAAILIEELRDEYDLVDIECLMESLDNACNRMNDIPKEGPEIPQAPCSASAELSLWRNRSGIKEE